MFTQSGQPLSVNPQDTSLMKSHRMYKALQHVSLAVVRAVKAVAENDGG
jgi:hypothetical protein